MSTKYDFINPSHYKNSSKETWQMMVDIWGVDKYIAYCEMNNFKYRMRAGLKPEQTVEQDLKKADWYATKAKELRGGQLNDSPPWTMPCNHIFVIHNTGEHPKCTKCGIIAE